MSADAVRERFDEGRSAAAPSALPCGLEHGVDGEQIVAVDANARNAVARTARRERAALVAYFAVGGAFFAFPWVYPLIVVWADRMPEIEERVERRIEERWAARSH